MKDSTRERTVMVSRDSRFCNGMFRYIRADGFLVFLVIAGLTLGTPLWADSFQFSLSPADGSVSAAAGSSAGWGYSITNDSSSDWLVTTNLTAGVFSEGTPSILFDFPIVAPNKTAIETFDPANGGGLYSLTWDTSATPGFVNSGTFVLSAEWWNGDPANGGIFISSAIDSTAAYTATATSATGYMPEPSTLSMCLIVFLIGLTAKQLKRGRGRKLAGSSDVPKLVR